MFRYKKNALLKGHFNNIIKLNQISKTIDPVRS